MTTGLTEIVFSTGYNPFALLRTKKKNFITTSLLKTSLSPGLPNSPTKNNQRPTSS